MQNATNQETLQVVESLMLVEPICFTTVNDEISIRITENSGPELILEDGTRIIFSSFTQYYSFISDKHEAIYDTKTRILNIGKLNELYFVKSDDVVDIKYRQKNVYHADLYVDDSLNPANIYRLYTM